MIFDISNFNYSLVLHDWLFVVIVEEKMKKIIDGAQLEQCHQQIIIIIYFLNRYI